MTNDKREAQGGPCPAAGPSAVGEITAQSYITEDFDRVVHLHVALRHDLTRAQEANTELASENAELRAKLAAAQMDAERYRWLRGPGEAHPYCMVCCYDCLPNRGGVELDAAIDAAIREAKGEA